VIGAFKFPRKVATIIRRSRQVTAGNEYLAAYARQFNPAVTTIPTSVDTDRYAPAANRTTPEVPIVGWIGSPTTAAYLKHLLPVLRRVRTQHPFTLRVSGAGEPLAIEGIEVDNAPWSLDAEVGLFNGCDVGVYPLSDDEWSKGKCGFKAIEFMSCGVPVVASAVGVNREIVQDGVNGFLASTEQEWIEKIGRLLVDPQLRRTLGAAGRRTIEERYSVRQAAPRLAATLRGAAGDGEKRKTA
jgi:glycosyltransferase involved in cell wall biosynthesis